MAAGKRRSNTNRNGSSSSSAASQARNKQTSAASKKTSTSTTAAPTATATATPVVATAEPVVATATPTHTLRGSSSSSGSSGGGSLEQWLQKMAWWGFLTYFTVAVVCKAAYQIRLGAIREFGPVIHEFDPYFNYRATEYLYWNGWQKFSTWFDYKVWYPLGRPVGTTIYPGMQVTAVWLKRHIFGEDTIDDTSDSNSSLSSMSPPTNYWTLNNVCVYIPVWFGVAATLLVGAITYEASLNVNSCGSLWQFAADWWYQRDKTAAAKQVSRSYSPAVECAVFSMGMMSIVPAHLMRSMGGGFDNESVAMTAMVLTFYGWMRSLRNLPVLFGMLTGIAYFYMVATWGGYVFVLNMIGVHAAVLVALGRFDTTVWLAYSVFYVVGTALAIQVPVVGLAPLKSLEQLGPAAVFGAYQLLMVCEVIIARRNSGNSPNPMTRTQKYLLRIQVLGGAAVVALILATSLAPTGYFGPISARVRGLFVQHTKTGNPLVDSVAEHQPASSRAYFQYLHYICVVAPAGYVYVWLFGLSNVSSFLTVWGTAAYFFSHKMVRLILLTAPIAASLGGIAAGRLFCWCLAQWWEEDDHANSTTTSAMNAELATDTTIIRAGTVVTSAESSGGGGGKMKKKRAGVRRASSGSGGGRGGGGGSSSSSNTSSFGGLAILSDAIEAALKTREGIWAKRTVSLLILFVGYLMSSSFVNYCWLLSNDLSNPSIMLKGRTRQGDVVLVDDYREAYWWLRDNTPEDARIMAWWDYGYQISAIANRTTIADGNTWNHEHIALLGKALTTDLDQGWEIARHLADYVLVWSGGGGDDLAKSPHLARIANSVYRDHCPDDPTCRAFGFLDRQGTPSAMMSRSLLFRLHSHEIRPGVTAPADKFRDVYQSKYGKVRIFKILQVDQESKAWVADPANRKCDVPGSWFCPGQYPPGLSAILAKKKDFSQLEDFNKDNADDEYTKKYFEDLRDPTSAKRKALEKEQQERQKAGAGGTGATGKSTGSMTEEELQAYKTKVDEIYKTWEDTEDTTRMWQLISSNNVAELKAWLDVEPHKAYIRSKDGRGPMFWAFEQRNEEITKLLMKLGVPHTDKDAAGLSAVDLLEGKQQQQQA